ncbi:MAG: hypothetical protein KGL59_11745 [Acidobacteriota bacterium]|nr:hypothetical protein [Acidobacteriota bacterium]
MRKNTGSDRNRFLCPTLLLLLPLALVSALSGAAPNRSAAQTAAPGPAAFPLSAGTSWVYQAVVRWGAGNSTAAQEKLIAWKMEVDRVIPRGDMVAAVVKGFPRDLDRSKGDTIPVESLIVESGGAKFYWIPPAFFKSVLARLENPADKLENLTTANQIFLQLPLAMGDKFCDMTGMIRTDGFYCWVAGDPQAADLSGVQGIPAGEHTAYPVNFLTANDSTSYDFVPGVGITRYRFQVQGTQTDTELHLEEFHPAAH